MNKDIIDNFKHKGFKQLFISSENQEYSSEYLGRDFPRKGFSDISENIYKPLNIRVLKNQRISSTSLQAKTQNGGVLVTLQFRLESYRKNSNRGNKLRTDYVRGFYRDLYKGLGLAQNDIQYFGTQEINSGGEVHLHLLFFQTKPKKTLIKIIQFMKGLLDPTLIIIPSPKKAHREDLKPLYDVFGAIGYILKQNNDLPFLTSHKFRDFWQRSEKEPEDVSPSTQLKRLGQKASQILLHLKEKISTRILGAFDALVLYPTSVLSRCIRSKPSGLLDTS